MQTQIPTEMLATPAGKEANQILRSCVHCGFCTATCPTYQLLGDELDGPRGRIYLIKQMLEGRSVSKITQLHLDRCLGCRSCETTCPSGVRYARLLDIGREIAHTRVSRGVGERLLRQTLRSLLPYPQRLKPLLGLGWRLRSLLPESLRTKVPPRQNPAYRPDNLRHRRRALILEGCAQSVMTPNTNAATARVLDRLGISLISPKNQGCCGAISHHLAATAEALDFVRNNIDAWWPHVEAGAEALLTTASGCGVMVRDYGTLLAADEQYREKAAKISSITKDLSEFLAEEELSPLIGESVKPRVACHSPCSLQHGMGLPGILERLMRRLDFPLAATSDQHLCCGSAGTYSILQPHLSKQLLENKVSKLKEESPELIVTANIGCQLHLASGAGIPVRHWIELVDEQMPAQPGDSATTSTTAVVRELKSSADIT